MPLEDNDRQQMTGKQRAIRMPLDYYKKSDRIERTKNWLTLLLALAALGLWLVLWLCPWPWGETLHSRGDLAAVHATWDKECSACHVDFEPISQDAAWTAVIGRNPHASDAKCQHCHAGPPHHANQSLEMTPACAHCHRDHQGRNFDLKRTADAGCTGCHANLVAASGSLIMAQEKRPFENRVTSWVNDHPDFHSLEADPRRLKFNHKLHMAPGMRTDEKGDPQFKLDMIDPAYRERYKEFANDCSLIQLDCAACHQLDGGDFGATTQQLAGVPSSVLPQRSAGAYFVPITYENQCKACHPLSFERKNPNDARSSMVSVPHRWQPSQIREFLQAHYTTQFLNGNLPSFKAPVPLPGRDPAAGNTLKEKAGEYINRLVAKAEGDLFSSKRSCGECHYTEPKEPADGKWSKVKIVPTQVPEIWFQHARFDHSAHRAMKCLDCHGGAETSASHGDVLIPKRDNCLQCHNTAPLLSTVGRARTDCVECHRYHNGDGHGLFQGIGAKSRGAVNKLSVESFLRGGE